MSYELRTEVHYLEANSETAVDVYVEPVEKDLAASNETVARNVADAIVEKGWGQVAAGPKSGIALWLKRIPPHRILAVFVTVHEKEDT